jgi:monoterpene epsilon-lactone hydrolase
MKIFIFADSGSRSSHMAGLIAIFLLITLLLTSETHATEESYAYLPSTISAEAKTLLRSIPDPNIRPASPKPDEIGKWKALQEATELATIERQKPLRAALGSELNELSIGGVPVLEIKPRDWRDNGKVIVYTHGGAYVLYSALSSFATAGLTADATGYRVLSIDYTLAPHANWREISDEIVAVVKGLLKQGYQMQDIALLGDSAGGGLAATTTLRLRNEGVGMPAAVVLYSPMADLTTPGDSYTTLKDAEPLYRLRGPQGSEESIRLGGLWRFFEGLSANTDSGGYQGVAIKQLRPFISGD